MGSEVSPSGGVRASSNDVRTPLLACGKQQFSGRILITGTRSGAGKTTVAVAIIAALKARGIPVSAFKCGPDYIDPMFLSSALGVPARNLDPYFSTPDDLRRAVAGSTRASIGVIEGVMGYFDGIGSTTRASTFQVADATETPAILVLDATGMAASAAAILQGFVGYRAPSHLGAVILNNATPGTYSLLEPVIRDIGLTPLGYLPRLESVTWPSRRLGLIPANEIPALTASITHLAQSAAGSLDLDTLLRLASSAPQLTTEDTRPETPDVRVAIANDEAFCFIYAETIQLFETLGAGIIFFSPMHDPHLPDADALYLPGGYPEIHAETLSANLSMRDDIRQWVTTGGPTIAECGGFMYLLDEIGRHPMVGAIPGAASITDRLRRFGYATLTATRDTMLLHEGEVMPVHEFHYADSTSNGEAFTATKASTGESYPCGHATDTLYAGFPHLYLPAVPQAAARFLRRARRGTEAHP